MNLIRNFFSAMKVRVISIKENQFVTTPEFEDDVNTAVIGFYCELEDGLLILFINNDGCLNLGFNRNVINVEHSTVKLYRTETKLQLIIDDVDVNENVSKPISTFWYSEDEEDANFLLWIKNLLSSSERREIFKNYNYKYSNG